MTDERIVVGAIVVDDLTHPAQVLAARRTSPAALVGKWEFPGGKVEANESAEAALRRELREELSIDVVLGDELVHPAAPLWPASGGYSMRLFWAEMKPGGAITLTGSHDDFRWLSLAELEDVEWLESDIAALPLIRTGALHGVQRGGPTLR